MCAARACWLYPIVSPGGSAQPYQMQTPLEADPPMQTPPGRHPWRQTPLDADPLDADPPGGRLTPDANPLGHVICDPVNRMTDRCKNITLPQTSVRR